MVCRGGVEAVGDAAAVASSSRDLACAGRRVFATNRETHAVALHDADFESGGLRIASCARPAKLFTAHESLLQPAVGTLSRDAQARVVAALVALLDAT